MARDGVTLGTALLRGLQRRCPHCGQASAFRGYLKIVDVCPSCQTALGMYPCDDGPAYVTIAVVGHLVLAPAFLLGFMWTYPLEILAPTLVVIICVVTLLFLPFIKGMYLALMWYLGLKSAG